MMIVLILSIVLFAVMNLTVGSVGIPADAVFSILQMPPGIPVATVSVNGAQNAAILAAQMIALGDEEIANKIDAWKAGLGSKIEKANKDLDAISDYKFKC